MSFFNLTAESLEEHNLNYMKNQLSQPDEPDLMYRAWPSSDGDHFYIESYLILRRTPAGVWIDNSGLARFINLSWTKRWACPTRKEAVDSLYKRMQSWEKILTRDLARARMAQQTVQDVLASM